MGDWLLLFTSTAEKSLSRFSPREAERIREAIDRLPAGDIKKLRGRPNEFRLRVGDFRVVFRPDYKASRAVILDVFRRGAGYR